MRIKQLLLITLVSILTLSSCGDDADSGNGGGSSSVTINLSQTTVNSPAVGGTFSVNVKTTGNEWTAFVNDDASSWLQLSITGSASNSGVATVTETQYRCFAHCYQYREVGHRTCHHHSGSECCPASIKEGNQL